jgi:nucleoid DNA-binding protein
MKNVTKKDLVEKIAEQTGLTRVDTKIIVECFLDSVSQVLQDGSNIEVRRFGRFKIKKKRARRARNPRTNQNIQVAAGYKPYFESSRELRKRINDAAGLRPVKQEP